MRDLALLMVLSLCAAPWGGCDEGPAGDGDADTDTDTDVDGDTDADGDTDVDTDVDGDVDTDVDGDVDGDADGDGGGDGGGEVDCSSGCFYVRAGATGSGDGSDWTNAATDLPSALSRGLVYLVAAGSYGSHRFDDGASGEALITLLRATEAAHGTDAGWDAAFGEGDAVFGPFDFAAPYYVVDGGPARGIRVAAEFQGSTVSVDADHVTLRRLDMDGAFAESGGHHTGGACTVLDLHGVGITVEGCEIHDAADDGVSAAGVRELRFAGNRVHRLHACGTDGGCGPCYNGHSDGLELYDVETSVFDGNLVYDVRSTAAVFFGNWADELGGGPDEYCEDVLLTNNVFYTPETGFAVYFQDVRGLRVYHNVIWGLHQGRYGGLAIGEHATGLEMFNNVILSINYDHIGATYDAAEHRGHHNLFGVSLGQYVDQPGDLVATDPGFAGIPDCDGAPVSDPDPEDFLLTAGSPCVDAGYPGDGSVVLPPADFRGHPRDGAPDIGAMEL